jgi:hypothetical protein
VDMGFGPFVEVSFIPVLEGFREMGVGKHG